MIRRRLNVLVIDPNEIDQRRIARALEDSSEGTFATIPAPDLDEAERVVKEESVDVILLELNLPRPGGLGTYTELRDRCPGMPVVVYSSVGDRQLALQAIRNGAQDVIYKRDADPEVLPRALEFAFERQNLQEQFKNMTLQDELTGLYNQRGFYALASEFADFARRSGRPMMVLFIDLDGLKAINDAYGHAEGSRAIMAAGGVLEQTFRESALLARWGGDEFVVLLAEPDGTTEEAVLDRINAALIRFNTKMRRGYDLAMSVGFAHLTPDDPRPVEHLLREADEAMYESKRKRKSLRTG